MIVGLTRIITRITNHSTHLLPPWPPQENHHPTPKVLQNSLITSHDETVAETLSNKTLGRALDPRANGAWLSKLTE